MASEKKKKPSETSFFRPRLNQACSHHSFAHSPSSPASPQPDIFQDCQHRGLHVETERHIEIERGAPYSRFTVWFSRYSGFPHCSIQRGHFFLRIYWDHTFFFYCLVFVLNGYRTSFWKIRQNFESIQSAHLGQPPNSVKIRPNPYFLSYVYVWNWQIQIRLGSVLNQSWTQPCIKSNWMILLVSESKTPPATALSGCVEKPDI